MIKIFKILIKYSSIKLNFVCLLFLGFFFSALAFDSVDKAPLSSKTMKDGQYVLYLLVSCMDFRLRDEVNKFMGRYVGKDRYDEIAIPGASLGVLNDRFPHWGETFDDVMGLAIKLHGVTNVIFLDHRDCGAYKMLKGNDCCNGKDQETKVHAEQFEAVRKMMKEKYPTINIESLIMGLDGRVEIIHRP